jgi:hypothetical protein
MLTSEQRETENELFSLEPTPPSENLRRRISDDISSSEIRKVRLLRPLVWFSAGSLLAASLTVLIYGTFTSKRGPGLEVRALEQEVLSAPLKGEEEFLRISDSSYLIEIEEGPVYLDESGIPLREIRLKYLDTEVYQRLIDGREVTVESIRIELSKSPSDSY